MTSAAGTLQLIPLSLIDEPELPMRESMDDQRLAELAQSIRDNGVVQPITVRRVVDRFEVVAGHRRTVASRMAGLVEVPCIVRDVDAAEVEQLKIAENNDRDDVNPADEASYLAELLTRHCHDDTDELAAFVKRSRQYVEGKLLLLRGHPDVFAAVRAGQIPQSVAHVLNQFGDDAGIKMHLESAKSGATARVVKQWLQDYRNFRTNNPPEAAPAPPSDGGVSVAPVYVGPVCECCKVNEESVHLVAIYVHDYCYRAVLLKLLRAYRGEEATVGG